jgi:hypothetical protein
MTSNQHLIEPEELMAYLDGELPADRATEVAEHLRECRECQILSAEFKSISEGLTTWEVPAVPVELGHELEAGLQERPQNKAGWRGWLPIFRHGTALQWAGGAIAASIVAVLIVSSSTLRLSKGHRANMNAAPAVQMAARSQTNAQGVVGGVPGGVTAGNVGSVRDFIAAQDLANMSESKRAELLQRMETAQMGSSMTVTEPTAIPARATGGDRDATPTPPMILRTAQIVVIAQNLDKARAGVDEIVQRYGGYLGDLNATAPSDGPRKLTATLRIPAGQLDAALAEVKKLGRVESESQSGQDVTAQYVDLEARLSNARNTERRLIDLLNQRTGKLSDVLEVETEVSRVREEVERMEGERRLMAKQVEFATVTATLSEEYKAPARALPDSLGTRFRNAAVEGYQSVVDFVIGVILFFISNGPMLLVWVAILFFPVRWAYRRMRKYTSST